MMHWLTLDTQVWQHVVVPASRPDRRELFVTAKDNGLRLGYTYDLIREVVDNRSRPEVMQQVAETIMELTGEMPVESNRAAEARELCDALSRDHQDWVLPPNEQEIREHALRTARCLHEIARGVV